MKTIGKFMVVVGVLLVVSAVVLGYMAIWTPGANKAYSDTAAMNVLLGGLLAFFGAMIVDLSGGGA